MSESPLNWYHCGRCGGMFQSSPDKSEGRICPHCGAAPHISVVETAPPQSNKQPPQDTQEDAESTSKGRGKRSTRKRKNKHIMTKLFLAWLLVLGLIILGARKLWDQGSPSTIAAKPAKEAPIHSAEDRELMYKAAPLCGKVLQGYMEAGTTESRNQYVWDPVATVSRMVNFDSLNPTLKIPGDSLKFVRQGLVSLPEGQAYVAVWESKDGKILDAVFRKNEDEWRLDWEHFARYSDYPWSLFLAGSGPEEGEFRLLARERLAESRKNEPDISVVLYAPRPGMPTEAGHVSPEFLVSRSTRDGQLLDAAFEAARAGKNVFDADMPEINPDRMIRVRVKVRRMEEDGVRKFKITRVIACHWYSVDEPGVEPLVRQPVPEEE